MPRRSNAWPDLLAAAEREVRRVQAGLPGPLRQQACGVPVLYEPFPRPELLDDDMDDDLMGLFVGQPFPDLDSGTLDVPAEIFLFLENIWEEAEGDLERFCDEVRTTYLHELGHYLGLEENDLEARGLE